MRKEAAVKNKMKTSWDDRLFDIIVNVILAFFVLVVAYPLYFVLIASVTDPQYVNNGTVLLYPIEMTWLGYQNVFANSKIWIGYANTLLYTSCGTILGTCVVLMAGYALSREDLPGRKIIMRLLVFTMYFGGGLIPFYLIVKTLNLTNTRTAMMILGSVSTYNIIVVRSFMEANIPRELEEAAIVDGCGNGRMFFQIIVPLSKAVAAVMVLFIAVQHWNSYFNAMIFLTDSKKYPLQLVLRDILLSASAASNSTDVTDPSAAMKMEIMVQVIKYGIIVVSTLPIICVYPFIQKYFVKGVMIGAVKG